MEDPVLIVGLARELEYKSGLIVPFQRRVIEICDEIVRRGLKVQWRCETRVDYLTDDTLRAMARAGCSGINFGVESSEVEVQKNVGRKPIRRCSHCPTRFTGTNQRFSSARLLAST